jgi:peptidoglycan/LPS O-acetylase OafA/YrhL
LPSLTGLRFLAAFGVVVQHANEAGVTLGPIAAHFRIANLGVSGVSLFFMLSGFVLVASRRPGDHPRAFWRRRVARVFPDHAVTWALAILVAVALEGVAAPNLNVLAATFLLVQSWSPHANVYFGNNAVEWTLSCEAFFYLCFPLAIVVLGRLDARGRRVALAALVGFMLALTAVGWVQGGFDHVSPTLFWLELFCPATRLPEFLIGMLLALELRERGGSTPVRVRHAVAALALALGWFLVVPSLWGPLVTVIPIALLLLALAGRDVAGRRTPLAWPPLVVLGEWSFALYLLHPLVMRSLEALDVTPHSLGHVPWAVLAVVLSIAAAGMLFTLVERPAERRWRGARPRLELEPAAAAA